MMLRLLGILFLFIPPLVSASINVKQFHQVPKDILKAMSSEIGKSGLKISLNLDWNSEVKNAGANRSGYNGELSFYGGYARIKEMTLKSYAHTVCHELGHLIAPGIKTFPTNKYASEAQSDYFATNICLKKYLTPTNEFNQLPDFHKSLCKNTFQHVDDLEQCASLMNASIDQLKVDNHLNPHQKWRGADFLDYSKSEITIFNDYPEVGCRYTTYIYGALNMAPPSCWLKKGTPNSTRLYIFDYEYQEAMFIGEVGSVQKTTFGCKFSVGELSFFQGSYMNPLMEDDVHGVEILKTGACEFAIGDGISGTISEYEGELYFNLDSRDK